MRHLLILLVFCSGLLQARAQQLYSPATKAKAIHDKAVNTYIKYSKNSDSIIAAIRMIDNALAIDSNYLIAWNNKLSFECQLHQYENALKTTRRMMYIFPSEPDLIFFNGVIAFKAGHTDEATAILDQLIKLYDKADDDNNDADHLKTTTLNKALALKILGRADESRKLLVNLSVKEHDLTVRQHINAYISKSKDQIINEIIEAR